MGDPSHVPELDHHVPAGLVHRLGDGFPALHLGLGVEAGRVLIAMALNGNRRAFRNDEAGARPRARHVAGDGAVARQGGHHDAVG